VTSGCGPLTVNFTDLSSGSPNSWTWDFGNGQISSQKNPSVTYGNPGTYTITLIVKNGSGASSARKTNYITVFPYPTASFSADFPLACAPANVTFKDLSTPGAGSITSWKWTFGDGASSTQQNPSHPFPNPGFYDISLTVVNSNGCSNNRNSGRYIRVVPGVQASFTYSQTSASCSPPFNINFINQTSGPGNLTYSWNLGNGVNSNATNPSTVYTANQTYTVNLLATSDLGCTDTAIRKISFQGGSAGITAPATVCVNNPAVLQNSSTPLPISSAWNFGDGTTSNQQNPSKTWTTASTFSVQLINTYAGCSDTISKNITVSDTAKPDFTATKLGSCKAPFTATFQDLTPAGTATGWQWDFGDGSPVSNAQNPSHTYTTAGTFDVTLTVTSASGCTGKVVKKAFITVAPPVVTLTPPSQYGCSNQNFSIFNSVSSIDGIASYAWTAPGANAPTTSTAAQPVFSWPSTGAWTINLTVTTNDGCAASFSFPNAVYTGTPTPATFTVAPSADECASTVFTLTGNTPGDHWTWNIGGADTTSMLPTIIIGHFSDTGMHTVKLTIVNNGCSNSATWPNAIHTRPPVARLGYKPDCSNLLSVNFADSSIVDPTLPLTYMLDYGDGSPLFTYSGPPPAPFPPHIYATYGIYPAVLTVTNGACPSVIHTNINILAPATNFNFPDTVCRNVNFMVTATGIDTLLIANYHWTVSTAPPVVTDTISPNYGITFTANGVYSVGLTVTDKFGCITSAPNHTIVATGPTAKFTVGPGGCVNSPIPITDNSTPGGAYPLTIWNYSFGDGPRQMFNSPPPSHTYADTGFYLIYLTLGDARGCVDYYNIAAPIQITSPNAFYIGPDSFFCANTPLPFIDSSTGYNLVYNWDFGDGQTSNLASPAHSFPVSGQKYAVKLKITDLVGCSDSMTRSISIQSPISAFTMTDTTTICPPLQTTFIPNGRFYDSLYWNFGDGTSSTLPNTTHFYNNYGPAGSNYAFTAYLVLRGPGGCLDSVGHKIYLSNPYNSTFTYSPTEQCDSVPVTFNVVSPIYTKFSISFGDGFADTSNIANPPPFHLYRNPSAYTPQLVMKDPTGCIVGIGSGVGPVIVLGAVPFFSMDKKKFCDSGMVNFTDFTITNDPITSETWSFGDGTTITNPNPSHYYSTPGEDIAQLIVNTQHNCTETYSDTVHVYPTPHPKLTTSNLPCVGIFQFEGYLTVPDPVDTIIWAWDFGNGQTGSTQNPSVRYSPGVYTVRLKTSVPFGCSDTASMTVTVNPLPVIKGPNVITTPVGIPVTLPFSYSENVNSFSWTPSANLSCTDCANPQASPTFGTLYNVSVTDANGCSNTDSILVKTICDGQNYFVPNTFSPNGDGVNDVFYPRGKGLYNIQSMRVFNRWGQLVFERRDFPANSAAMGWDGNFNGRPAQSDVYIYMIDVVCNNAQVVTLKGDVTLIR
jgi:gliding motility-associated-like protein